MMTPCFSVYLSKVRFLKTDWEILHHSPCRHQNKTWETAVNLAGEARASSHHCLLPLWMGQQQNLLTICGLWYSKMRWLARIASSEPVFTRNNEMLQECCGNINDRKKCNCYCCWVVKESVLLCERANSAMWQITPKMEGMLSLDSTTEVDGDVCSRPALLPAHISAWTNPVTNLEQCEHTPIFLFGNNSHSVIEQESRARQAGRR